MQHKICDACETVAHCSNHGCVPLTQIRAAEAHHPSGGYSLGTQEAYEAAVAQRDQSSDPPPPSYEELLQEVWYLRRRVKTLEQQVFEMNKQISGKSMGR